MLDPSFSPPHGSSCAGEYDKAKEKLEAAIADLECPEARAACGFATRWTYAEARLDTTQFGVGADEARIRMAEVCRAKETEAWRCCGIASEALGAIKEHDSRTSTEFIRRTPSRDQLIRLDSAGATHYTCPSTGKRFVNVFGDGSLLHGRSVWHARAAWGLGRTGPPG